MSCTISPIKPDATPAALDTNSRRTLIYFTTVLALMLLASIIYAPWVNNGPILCPFRLLTGLPCPGCGLTRSFCAMSRGQFAMAASYHLFGPLAYFVALFSIPIMLYQALTGRRVEWFMRVFYSRKLARVLAIALGGYHLVRLVGLAWSGQMLAMIAHGPMVDLLRRTW
jgi:Protein of unknown function (DUF2752)